MYISGSSQASEMMCRYVYLLLLKVRVIIKNVNNRLVTHPIISYPSHVPVDNMRFPAQKTQKTEPQITG